MKGYRKLVKGEFVQAGDIFRNKVMYRPLKAVERRSKSPNSVRDAIALAKQYVKAYPASLTFKQVMSGFVEWVGQQHP